MNMSNGFENSPEHDEWEQSGGRDSDRSEYYNQWHRRTQR